MSTKATNGRPTAADRPALDIDSLTLDDLREHVERRRLAIELQAMEASAQWFDNWVDPREPYLDDPDFWQPMGGAELVPTNQDHRNKGEVLPVYLTEGGLKLLRDQSRRLLAYNEFAINASENRIAYIVGTGFQYKATCDDEGLAKATQAVIDEFSASNRLSELEQETVQRCDEDGETILRLFPLGAGRATVRVVEPEHLAAPVAANDRAGFGVETAPGDICTVVAYHVREEPDISWETTPVEPAEIVHIKLNTKRNAKRGLPTFTPVRKNLERAEKLLRNMSIMAQVRATYAVVRRHKGMSKSSVETMQTADADLTYTTPFNARTRHVQTRPPGSIVDAPESTSYEFPATGADAAALVTILQAELRAVAARLVMPEYMLTTDASNAAYASTMVAEAPSTKNFERLQKFFARQFGDGSYGDGRDCGLLWRVIKIAVDAGRLPPEALEHVKIQVEGPTIIARDKAQETARSDTLNQRGIMSKSTWSKQEGLDYEQEQQQLQQEAPAQQAPGQPGEQPDAGPGLSMDEFDDPTADGPPDDDDQADDFTEADAGGGFTGTLKDKRGREYTYQNGKRIAHPDGATDQHLATADRVAGQRHAARQDRAAAKGQRAERKQQWSQLKQAYHASRRAAEKTGDRVSSLALKSLDVAGVSDDWHASHEILYKDAIEVGSSANVGGPAAFYAARVRSRAANLASRLATADTSRLTPEERAGNAKTVKTLRQIAILAGQARKHNGAAMQARRAAQQLTNVREDKQDSLGRWHDDKGHLVAHGHPGSSSNAHLAVQPDAHATGGKPGLLRKLGRFGRGVRVALYYKHKALATIARPIKATFSALPKPLKRAVKGALRVTFSSYIAGNAAAAAVAKEVHGERHGRKVAMSLMAADYTAAKTVIPTVALVAPAVASVAYWFPMASCAYLAYSTAKNPRATIRAAVKAVKKAHAAGALKTAKSAVLGEAQQTGHNYTTEDVRLLFKAFERHADDADWYEAVMVASLAATRGDIRAAIRLADVAAKSHDTVEELAPGYTGDAKDKAGRLYHYVRGRRVKRSAAGTGPAAKKTGTAAGDEEYQKRKADNERYARQMAAVATGGNTPAEAVEGAKRAVKLARSHNRKGRTVGPEAVNEAVVALLAGTRLASHEAHGFDSTGTIAGRPVLLDAKHSATLHGYHDTAKPKLAKVKEWKRNRDAIPAFVSLSEGHGLVLHVGIDPKSQAAVGPMRPIVKPGELGQRMDGSGKPLPFVVLSDKVKSLSDLDELTEGDVRAIRSKLTTAIKGLDMAKVKEHVGKQVAEFEGVTTLTMAKEAPDAYVKSAVEGLDAEKAAELVKLLQEKHKLAS